MHIHTQSAKNIISFTKFFCICRFLAIQWNTSLCTIRIQASFWPTSQYMHFVHTHVNIIMELYSIASLCVGCSCAIVCTVYLSACPSPFNCYYNIFRRQRRRTTTTTMLIMMTAKRQAETTEQLNIRMYKYVFYSCIAIFDGYN